MKRLFIKNKIVAGLLALSMAVAGAISAAPPVYAEVAVIYSSDAEKQL